MFPTSGNPGLIVRTDSPRHSLILFALIGASAITVMGKSESESITAGGMVFSLLPKSFQKDPLLDQTVITEMTPEGRKVPPPTVDRPAYYVIHSGGSRDTGPVFTGAQSPTEETLHRTLGQVLSAQGYRQATPARPPSLLLLYFWGSSNLLEGGEEDASGNSSVSSTNLLTKAALVGGDRFAGELSHALREQEDQNQYQEGMTRLEKSFAQEGLSVALGVRLPKAPGSVRRFLDRDDHNPELLEQALANCYYIIVSAYDYASVADGRRHLLWRTKMTVTADGVAMPAALPALIVNAGKYFGRDMAAATTMSNRIPKGRVDLGDLEVKEYMPAPGAKPAVEAPPPATR